jgi:2-polyprenyl-3-methyl-5-hydroxy-6-metoxy-1,4-benzoquinol methylase
MDRIACTVCGSANTKLKLDYSLDIKIVYCENCNNAFTYPKPILPDYASEDFQAAGKDLEQVTNFGSMPEEIQTSYRLQLKMIQKNVSNGANILEIGGGEGIFLDLVKSAGYQVELVEPSLSAAHRARQRGLSVRNDYFHNLTFDKKYSLICLSHVLEHIDDPIKTIQQLALLLEPSGFILLAQTNFKGFMPRFLKKNWYAWVPHQHFTHFSVDGLDFVAHQSNLRLKDYKYSRLVHGKSVYHSVIRYVPFLQDQIHILLQRQ